MWIYCTGCEELVDARLTGGREVYPRRPDLFRLAFWKCDTCGALVGCHHKNEKRNRPLGYLATPEIRRWRMKIHQLLDPLWQNGLVKRKTLYKKISRALGHEYHNAQLYDAEEAQFVYDIVKGIKDTLDPPRSPWNR